MRPAKTHATAFTLVEVLTTIAFMAILLPTVMQGVSLCLRTADNARQRSQAASLCHGKLCELAAYGQQLQHVDLSGDFGEDWPEYRWEAAVGDWDGITLLQLEVSVIWTVSGEERKTTMTTLVYSPTLGTTQ
jgi:type II secretory pathway pseudopilin PulG